MDKRAETGHWVMRVPVISTAHIAPAIGRELHKTLPGEEFYEAVCMVGAHGAMIRCADIEHLADNAPQCLRDVLAWGRAQGYDWVRLDGAGDSIARLAEYAW